MDSSPEILDFDSSDENGPENSGIFLQQWDAQVRPYIEMIDFMRQIGIERELALPSIAVVGDQSSGKSSVLEALSGVALPRGSGIVTRCPLELKLRKLNSGSGWTAIISYNDVRETFHDPAQVESYVRRAQNMLAGDGVGICDDLISLEITSPDVCNLTLIDLPGITRVPVKGQPEDIGDQIRRLILKFIAKKETINLVVVPCNVDVATTEALRMAQGVDPDGSRTLAILTKPDLVDKGAEADILQVLQGKVVPLKKGYTIVRCRGQSDINENVSLAEATRQEKEFFANHVHFRYYVAFNLASLPSLRDQIHIHLSAVRFELKSYDDGPPLEPERMGPYLSKNHIDEIHSKQESKVEKRIYEYINMEKLVYTQDPIFTQKIVDFKFVEKRQEYESISLDTGENATSPNNCAVFDTRSLTPEKLIIYYEIVYQRLADYIPMVILLFILKEAAVMLRAHAMDLRDGADVVKLLVEDTEAGRKRADLHQRMERLRLAQERIRLYL
ncbi:Interferon-induced GTP-binding protein Mx [Anabarilius grahami]|uniref:Interferon-induced GTP-binding protein Mx n=1 Tax=Anabarilius grahami TaxID=495550 RepID=A0A3N0YDJ6_ANAGA|nr:Interferon-induced GTP-binding protein Mx [Anabarilius grahami]